MDDKQEREDLFPRMTVGVIGSAGGNLEEEVRLPVRRLGAAIARRGYVLQRRGNCSYSINVGTIVT